MRIRAEDQVIVIAGKDKGKTGKVIRTDPRKDRVYVEGLNMIKRHTRPRPMSNPSRMGQTQIQPGGVFDVSAAIEVSNVMVVCPTCNRATRVGYEHRESKDGRVKVRVCKRADCGEVLDR